MLSDEQLQAVKLRITELVALMEEAVEAAIISPEEANLIVVQRVASQLSALRFDREVSRPRAAGCCDDRR
jgi:hypothetical protein